MIDVSKINDLEQLRDMKKDLQFFLIEKMVATIYKERKRSKNDLEKDYTLVQELLENVVDRISQFEVISPETIKEESQEEQSDEEHGCYLYKE